MRPRFPYGIIKVVQLPFAGGLGAASAQHGRLVSSLGPLTAMSTSIPDEVATVDEVQQLRARVAELERDQRIAREIIARAPVMISVVRGPDFVYESVNPAFQALAPGKEFVGRRFADVWAEVSDPPVEILHNVLQTGEAFRLEDGSYTIKRGPDAPPEVVYVSYSWIPVAGLDGRPDSIITLAHETTASVRQRQADQRREADRQLLETVVGTLPTGTALIRGADLKFILVNPAYQANAAAREMVGKTVEEVWPEYHPASRENCLRVLATGEAYHAVDELITIRRSGDSNPERTFWTWSLFRITLPGEDGWGLMSVTIQTTERKRAEQPRRDNEADFETLANLVPQLVWMCNPDGLNFYFNQRWVRYTGLTLEESYGTGWSIPFHPDHRQAARDAWSHATRSGEKYSIECRLRDADGDYRWFLIVGEPLKDGAGNVVRWFGTCTDIEELKQAEEALRESEERFRALVTASSDMLYRMSPDAREMRQLQGRGFVSDVETPTANWLQKLVPPEDHARTLLAINQAVLGKSTFQVEHRVIRDDGTIGWVFSRAVPLRDTNGNIVEWFGAASDITDRKKAEESLGRQAALLDLAHDAILVRADDDTVSFWSQGAQATYGFTPAEALGQVTHQLLSTRFPGPLAEIKRDVVEKGRWEGELVHIRKDGREITVDSRWAVQRDSSGRAMGFMEVNRDITDRKQMEQGLRESRDRLALAQQIARAASFDLDLKAHSVVWSEELQQLYGIGPGEPNVDMKTWADWVLPEDRGRLLADFAAALETGEVITQFRICRRDNGEIKWIDGRGRVLRDHNGEPARMIGFSIDITEQKVKEEELRQSIARERVRATELEAFMNVVPGAIFIAHDPECRYIYGNRATHKLLRREPGDNLSLSAPEGEKPANFRIMRNGIEIPPHELPVQKAALTGQPVESSELNLIFDDGISVTWFGGAAPLLDERGRPRGSIGVFVDITERKRAEQALQDSEERLRLAQEAAGISHFDWNLVTGEANWSDSLKRLVGSAPTSTLESWDKLSLVHPDDRHAFQRQLESAISGQSSKVSISYRSTTQAGEPCWRLCEARVQNDEKGRPVRMLGVIADITAHKQAERMHQIEQERKHLEAGIGTLADGVLLADATGQLLSMNLAATRLFGFDSDASAPPNLRGFTELFEITELDGNPVPVDEWPVARVLRGEVANPVELRCRNRKTGRNWIASYGCAPVLDEAGAIIMVVVGVHDTTADRAASEEMRRANAALHDLSGQLLRLQDDERRRIARELHDGTVQVLSAALMNLTVLSESAEVHKLEVENRLVSKTLDLAQQCVKELRTMSYLLHPPTLDELGLAAALRSWIDGFSERTGIPIDIAMPDDLGRLDPDVETALFRITQEALGNVHRHAESTTAGVRLGISKNTIVLEIVDDGKGFDWGASGKSVPDRKFGVGLLGMRERAIQLGGSLDVDSRPGSTVIRVTLPINITSARFN